MATSDGLSAILFDLDGTLRYSNPRGVDAFHNFAERLGFSAAPERRRRAWRWVYEYWTGSPQHRIEKLAGGTGEGQDFWLLNTKLHLRELGAPEDQIPAMARGIVRLFADEYQPLIEVPEDVPETLSWLRDQGYILGVVSNRQDPLDGELAKLGLDLAFDITLAAGEIDLWKPDPRLLLHAAALAGLEPEAMLYVGDNYFADVLGARAAGMWPVLVDPMGLFSDMGCTSIACLGELPGILGHIRSL